MKQRRTAAEIIGFHFCSDIRDIQDGRYQPSRYRSPAVYVIGDDYVAAPSNNRPPSYEVGKPWVEIGEHYGRKVFMSECSKV